MVPSHKIILYISPLRSLKYVDLNIFNHSSFHRSTIETEIGSVACYLGVDSVTYEQISSKPVPLNNLRSGFGNLHVCQLRNERLKGNISFIENHVISYNVFISQFLLSVSWNFLGLINRFFWEVDDRHMNAAA